jgi:hypothetical protein
VILKSLRRQTPAVAVLIAYFLASAGATAQSPQSTDRQVTAGSAEEPARGFALWFGHGESDNVLRTEAPERGSYDAAGAFFELNQESARFDSSLRSNIELRSYSDDIIEDEVVGTLTGQMDVRLFRDSVSWLLHESYSQGRTDPFAAPGPNNRESINVFTTGPQFDVPLGGRTTVSAAALHSIRRYDESDALDSDARVYELGLYRQRSSVSRFGLVVTTNDVEFDLPATPEYAIDRLSLNYEKMLATGAIDVAIGTNEITLFGETLDEPLFNFSWNRQIAARSTLRIEAAQQFSDAGTELRLGSSEAPAGDLGTFVTASPFEQQQLFVSYSLAGTRTFFTASLGTTEEDYVGDALDNDNTTTTLSLRRIVTPRLDFGVVFSGIEREFVVSATERPDTDKTISAWVNRSLGRVFGVALVLTRYERGGPESFDENRYDVRFTYSPSGSATTALGVAAR